MAILTALHTAHSSLFSTDGNPDATLHHASPGEELGSPEFWCKMVVSILLVLLGGIFAGYVHFFFSRVVKGKEVHVDNHSLSPCDVRLTLGLMGLDELHLRVLSTSSEDATERKNAAQGSYQTRWRFNCCGTSDLACS